MPLPIARDPGWRAPAAVAYLILAACFLLFLGMIWSSRAADSYGLRRYGYAPFALPNVLFMLIPHALLLLALQEGYPRELLASLAGAGMLGMLLIIRIRTNGWLALLAAPVQLVAAPVLVLSVLFRALAATQSGQASPHDGDG